MYAFTGLEEFAITNETCFICGRKADSKEHLFPKWLLHKFDLWNQELIIPNKTSISYRQLIVPCCRKCNNETFANLESKLANKTETDSDIWQWANKIHYGLTLKDQFLAWDRKNPAYKIGDVISPSDVLEQSRHFLHCVSGDFKTSPDPFGSVFKFEFDKEQDFNFVHMINSQSICISFGNRGYIIFIRDGQYLKNTLFPDYELLIKQKLIGMYDMLFFYAKAIEYMERFTVSIPILVTPGQITKIGGATIRKEKPVNKPLLSAICNHLGFTWVDSDEI